MKRLKGTILILIAAIVCFAACACSKGGSKKTPSDNGTSVTVVTSGDASGDIFVQFDSNWQ